LFTNSWPIPKLDQGRMQYNTDYVIVTIPIFSAFGDNFPDFSPIYLLYFSILSKFNLSKFDIVKSQSSLTWSPLWIPYWLFNISKQYG